jgi:hypothetical protein
LVNPSEYTLSLVAQALDDLASNRLPLSAIIQKTIRIARLREDYVNLWWLEWEMVNIIHEKTRFQAIPEIIHLTKDQIAFFDKEFKGTWVQERLVTEISQSGQIGSGTVVYPKGIGEIEADLTMFTQAAAESQVPSGLHPVDLYFEHQATSKVRVVHRVRANDCAAILQRVRQRVHRFLSQTEKQMIYGQLHSDVFERNRRYVDLRLGELCPDAIAKFVAAYSRITEDDPESRAQALTSCRRLLKSLADVLYPSRDGSVIGADGKPHDVSDERYVARLWQYVYEQIGRSRSGDLLMTSVEDLGSRIDKLYSLASKGVHAEVSDFEANQCVIQTYILAGDLIRIHDQQFATGIGEVEAATQNGDVV